MDLALLDTDILSEVIKGFDKTVAARASSYAAEYRVLTFTSASVYEILSGLHRKNAKAQIQRTETLFARELAVSLVKPA